MTTKSIPEEIAELRALDVKGLVARYETLFGRPPRIKHKEYLWKRCAWRIQELRFGGLSDAAKRRIDELVAELDLPLAEALRTTTGRLAGGTKPRLSVGTTIERDWRGQRIAVHVVENGFEWNEVLYRSLSAVAKAVTGTHWNGHLFFGLSKGRNR